jgi:hypothetical protein
MKRIPSIKKDTSVKAPLPPKPPRKTSNWITHLKETNAGKLVPKKGTCEYDAIRKSYSEKYPTTIIQ